MYFDTLIIKKMLKKIFSISRKFCDSSEVLTNVFENSEDSSLLGSLINSILSPKDEIRSMQPLNTVWLRLIQNQRVLYYHQKSSFLLNFREYASFLSKRTLYYWSTLYRKRLETRADYHNLVKTIGIHILDCNKFLSLSKVIIINICSKLKTG